MVTLSAAANGTLSNLGGGSYDAPTGIYTDASTAAAVTTALDGLVFTPTAKHVAVGQTATTTFTITDTDTLGASATDSPTTVIATAVAAPPLIVNNSDGTSYPYTHNPTSTVTETIAIYSGANATGTMISDIVDNSDGTSLLYAYNPTSTVTLTASYYSGTDPSTGAPSGTLTSETFDYASGGSSITRYNSNGTSSTIYYSGPDGTGTTIPAITSAPETSSAVAFAAASVISTPAPSAQAEPAPDGTSIMISGSDQLIDPGTGNHSIQFISGAADDTLVLHSGGSDQVTGFNPIAGDQLDLSSLLAEAHVSLANISQLGNYVSVANINGAAQILFDLTRHGADSQAALLLNDGSLATQIQTSILAQHNT